MKSLQNFSTNFTNIVENKENQDLANLSTSVASDNTNLLQSGLTGTTTNDDMKHPFLLPAEHPDGGSKIWTFA